MRLQKMRKASGCYLIALGALETALYLLRDNVPAFVAPYFSLLWMPFFAESDLRSVVARSSMCVLLVIAGIGLLTKRKWLAIPYCIVGALVAVVDLNLPVVYVTFGGHVVEYGAGAIMWLAALLYDALPVVLAFWMVGHSDENRKSG